MSKAVIFGLLLAVASMQVATTAAGGDPSFDCAKASSDTERLICASDQLGEIDRQLAKEYRALRDTLSAGRRAALVRDQHAWLGRRDDCCGYDPPTESQLVEEYSFRLRALEVIANRPEVFTDQGWDLDYPTIHGHAFARLPAGTRTFVYRKIRSAFQPAHVADRLSNLTMKDSHSGELFLDFDVRPICHGLSELAVGASRTSRGKRYEIWRAVFYEDEHLIEDASFSADAVQKCTQDGPKIIVETDDDYDPRSNEYLVTNVSRHLIDTISYQATVEKVAPPTLTAAELIGTFFDGRHYHRIELKDGAPTVVEVTDLHGSPLKLWAAPGPRWDAANATLTWSFAQALPIYYGGTNWVHFDFKVSTRIGSDPVAEVSTDPRSGYSPQFEKVTLTRVPAPLYRPLDYYYDKPSIDSLELRRDFYDEHGLEPDPREHGRQVVCRKIDRQFVGFLLQNKFVPTQDVGPVPAGYDPAKCQLCIGSESARRQTCGFGRFAM